MQIIGFGFVVKYTYARGQVTKSEDMPRPDARGRGRGWGQHVEAEAEDKISASRTVWPRGLNITAIKWLVWTDKPRLWKVVTEEEADPRRHGRTCYKMTNKRWMSAGT